MASVNFKYEYPYVGYGEKGRFQTQWSDNQIKLNGNYTNAMVFNTPVPNCDSIVIDVEIENTGYGSVFGISWDFYVYRSSSWYVMKTFIMPSDGKYTLECDLKGYTISQIAFVPSGRQSTSRTWSNWYNVNKLVLTETLTPAELETGYFQNGVFSNRYGVNKELTEVYVNVDGVLKRSTEVLANIDGELFSVPSVYSSYLKTKSDSITLYKFTPPVTNMWPGGELQDGSFEDGSGWMTTRGGTTPVQLNSNDSFHGSKSFAFYYAAGIGYVNNAYHAVYLTPGIYHLSYYTKGTSAGNVHIENSSGIIVLSGTAGGNNSKWTKIDCTNELTVYNATTLYVRAVSTGTDRLIDGITLLKLGTTLPKPTTKYRIKNNRLSGDHEIRLYDSDFNPLYNGYFYDSTFDLVEGQNYYITQTHYYTADESESYLQIYKED